MIVSFCLIFLALFFAGCRNNETPTTKTIRVVGFGDSISAGFAPQNTDLYSYYNDYISGKTKINAKCYTNILANSLKTENNKINAISYAESGDTTDDLVNKLNDIKTYPDLLNDSKKADIITLSIGANNVLGPVLDNMLDYLAGNMSKEEMTQVLQNGYENFRDDYTNTIIPILTRGNGVVLVMTIYDPYKYFDLTESNISGIMADLIDAINDKFVELKELAIEYINKINDYIRAQKFDNVFVVDVNNSFENLSKEDYVKYLNVNSEELTIQDMSNIQNSVNVDPHPTLEGQEYIGSLFREEIKKISNQNA